MIRAGRCTTTVNTATAVATPLIGMSAPNGTSASAIWTGQRRRHHSARQDSVPSTTPIAAHGIPCRSVVAEIIAPPARAIRTASASTITSRRERVGAGVTA